MEGPIRFTGGGLHVEGVAAAELAQRFGTPLYVYSAGALREALERIRGAFRESPEIYFPVKANGLGAILRLLASDGCGFDVVSGGELKRIQAAGLAGSRVVFAGVGKEAWEIEEALSRHALSFINVESLPELEEIEAVAGRLGVEAPLALRLNPDIQAGGHPYLATSRKRSKFGLPLDQAAVALERAARSKWLRVIGYHVHLGSLVSEPGPYLAALERVQEWAGEDTLRQEGIEYYDAGGGYAVPLVPGEESFSFSRLAPALEGLLGDAGWKLALEPGRFLVGGAGILLTQVIRVKAAGGRKFVVVDAAMNDFLRPSLYKAEHMVWPVEGEPPPGDSLPRGDTDIVGPVCESGDFLALNRDIPPVERGDFLALFAAGAYGDSMASRYNSRRLAAQVVVDGSEAFLARPREPFQELWKGEVWT